ncbi:putative N-acetyltransferase YjaB [Pseudoruegeria aquimaris]|uniref:Putative N-acetyltransferase YjaB n=1 Tax=Pseudoruegeria aquimaris TaxID=393663 RepID=A0A1Y5SHX4_9RHOB|nr:GNAT family N-acetyltransferase [Pseudoruegeria aquimaris]SLN40048.1 putative N-acetyltransferase YjaB [Pseudoruegeria aquimaris]
MIASARPPRAVLPRDVAALCTLYGAALRGGAPALPESFIAAEQGNLRTHYLPATRSRVIGAPGTPEGFISVHGAEVAGLFVDPAYQGRGIGSRLLAWAATTAPELHVFVFTENRPARAFYAARAFAPAGEEIHVETGLPILRLEAASARILDRLSPAGALPPHPRGI